MKNNDGYRNTAFLICLMLLLSVFSTILFVNVSDSEALMYEEGVTDERN